MKYYIFYFGCLLIIARIYIWLIDVDEKKKLEQRKKNFERFKQKQNEPKMFVDEEGELIDLNELIF